MEAVLGLAGVAVGALMVFLGDWLRHRRETERQWRSVLIDRAATFRGAEWQQAKDIEDWRRRRHLPLEGLVERLDQLEADRRLAVSYLMVLPGSTDGVRTAAIDMMRAVDRLSEAADGDAAVWDAAREHYRQTRERFDATIRAAAGGPPPQIG